MRAYVCVYRHHQPSKRDRAKTEQAAKSNPLLSRFLGRYNEGYFDWGDDPSFFAAEHIIGDVRAASWGVCRRDVREAMRGGGFIVFFVVSQLDDSWEYYWAGVGTIKRLVPDRRAIWTDPTLAAYKHFFNLLVANGENPVAHLEFFNPWHTDWKNRMDAPYVLFDPDLSRFDLQTPLHVSTYTHLVGTPDRWRIEDPSVNALHELLFSHCKKTRRLRTSHAGHSHPKLRLPGTDEELLRLRTDLLSLFESREPSSACLAGPPPGKTNHRSGGCS